MGVIHKKKLDVLCNLWEATRRERGLSTASDLVHQLERAALVHV